MASGNDHTRSSKNAGLGLGNQYDHANLSAATSMLQAETNRIAKGVGIGAGSAVDFSSFTTPAAAERTNEDARSGKSAGLAVGSTVSPS